ncbi:hypothetical protein [Deinococcus sp. 6GRE01]|uniref:hypothetical protein n=1 Tax=Deinococcus sp. 6GRE01 TaxID=2745873 RepID=UPI001E397049|nr:hypothetical protein [Deinococcus sp. 6GRE01]MCD0155957.1 hypothetical protein [Deinococcus sp. 6GRE01]
MPGNARDRKALKNLAAQQREQRHAAPAQPQKPGGNSPQEQHQGLRIAFQPVSAPSTSVNLSPEYVAPQKPTPQQEVQRQLARLPQVHGNSQEPPADPHPDRPLTVIEEATLDLLDQFLGDCVREIRNPESFDRLVNRIDEIGTKIGRAVRNAVAEAGR